jgi:hypothetical protein
MEVLVAQEQWQVQDLLLRRLQDLSVVVMGVSVVQGLWQARDLLLTQIQDLLVVAMGVLAQDRQHRGIQDDLLLVVMELSVVFDLW